VKTHGLAEGGRTMMRGLQRDCGREIEAFRDTKRGAQYQQFRHVSREASDDRDEAPDHNAPKQDPAARKSVGDIPRERRCDCIGLKENQAGQSDLGVGRPQVGLQGRNDRRQRRPVGIIQSRRNKEKNSCAPRLGQMKNTAAHEGLEFGGKV